MPGGVSAGHVRRGVRGAVRVRARRRMFGARRRVRVPARLARRALRAARLSRRQVGQDVRARMRVQPRHHRHVSRYTSCIVDSNQY